MSSSPPVHPLTACGGLLAASTGLSAAQSAVLAAVVAAIASVVTALVTYRLQRKNTVETLQQQQQRSIAELRQQKEQSLRELGQRSEELHANLLDAERTRYELRMDAVQDAIRARTEAAILALQDALADLAKTLADADQTANPVLTPVDAAGHRAWELFQRLPHDARRDLPNWNEIANDIRLVFGPWATNSGPLRPTHDQLLNAQRALANGLELVDRGILRGAEARRPGAPPWSR